LTGVAFSPDSRTAFCGNENCVRRWDVASGKEVNPLRADMGRVRSLALSGDGRKLLAGASRFRLAMPGLFRVMAQFCGKSFSVRTCRAAG
jgi:WD40 repeat protein